MAPTKESGALPFHKGKNQGFLQRSLTNRNNYGQISFKIRSHN